MNLLGHLETDEAVNALNSIVVLATVALRAQLATIFVTFELSLTFLHTLHLSKLFQFAFSNHAIYRTAQM